MGQSISWDGLPGKGPGLWVDNPRQLVRLFQSMAQNPSLNGVPFGPSCCSDRSTGIGQELEDWEGWGGWRCLGDLRCLWGHPSADLLSPSLLQNTDLFEMIEKMQVRRALMPVLGSH